MRSVRGNIYSFVSKGNQNNKMLFCFFNAVGLQSFSFHWLRETFMFPIELLSRYPNPFGKQWETCVALY